MAKLPWKVKHDLIKLLRYEYLWTVKEQSSAYFFTIEAFRKDHYSIILQVNKEERGKYVIYLSSSATKVGCFYLYYRKWPFFGLIYNAYRVLKYHNTKAKYNNSEELQLHEKLRDFVYDVYSEHL